MKKYGFVILLFCLVGFSFVPVFGQIGMPSHSIANPDSVSHNFYELMSLKDGSTPTEPLNSSLEIVSLEPIYRAFLETFTPEEIRVLAQNNEVLLVGYALSESGSVLEVDFSMYRNRPHLYNIPPQYLEKLEAKLKSTVHYVIPEYKRQQLCKYNVITVSQVFPFKSLLDKL